MGVNAWWQPEAIIYGDAWFVISAMPFAALIADHLGHGFCRCVIVVTVYDGSVIALGWVRLHGRGANARTGAGDQYRLFRPAAAVWPAILRCARPFRLCHGLILWLQISAGVRFQSALYGGCHTGAKFQRRCTFGRLFGGSSSPTLSASLPAGYTPCQTHDEIQQFCRPKTQGLREIGLGS